MQLLLQDGRFNPGMNNNASLVDACSAGYLDIIATLLNDPRVNPADGGDYALEAAVENNQIESLRLLLSDPRFNPHNLTRERCTLIGKACSYGYLDIVTTLLSYGTNGASYGVRITESECSCVPLAFSSGYYAILMILFSCDSLLHNLDNDMMKKILWTDDVPLNIRALLSEELNRRGL